MVRICLLPEVEVSHSLTKSMAIYQMVILVYVSFAKGNIEPWLFICGIVYRWLYIFLMSLFMPFQ